MELSYISKTPGIGGTIKNSPEDFIVEEITTSGEILEINKKIEKETKENKFVHFILQKRDWSTSDAIKTIAKKLCISFKRFNFAGTKDKIAISTQLCSCFGIEKEEVEQLKIKDIRINGAWYANDKVKLGDLLGNRFTIKVEGVKENAEEIVNRIYSELNGTIPNYFGEQRFGTTRRNTHIIGEKLVRARLKDAMMTFICDSEGEEHVEAKLARKELQATGDFETALKKFPTHLRLERTVIAHLAENENDFAGAFRKLPRNILLLFIHAFQSHMFNILLSEKIKNVEKSDGNGNIIGYETELTKRENELLDELGIRKEDFKIRSLPEISSKGTKRAWLVELKDFSFSNNTFKFSLPAGSYATVALREFLDEK
ncbi:tRNA pseudouridine(13) synthase TruD [Candidatus Micrarchaeota archaeon]|nr:tRNA pseudouridine(13) synthase TruD [Candidatus Micrarchaeota archaeon]